MVVQKEVGTSNVLIRTMSAMLNQRESHQGRITIISELEELFKKISKEQTYFKSHSTEVA